MTNVFEQKKKDKATALHKARHGIAPSMHHKAWQSGLVPTPVAEAFNCTASHQGLSETGFVAPRTQERIADMTIPPVRMPAK